jgi:hypothetical protein
MAYHIGDIIHYIGPAGAGAGDKYGRVTAANPPQYTVVRVDGPGPNAAEVNPQQVHNITDELIIAPPILPIMPAVQMNGFNNINGMNGMNAQGRRRRSTRRRRSNRRRRNTRRRH